MTESGSDTSCKQYSMILIAFTPCGNIGVILAYDPILGDDDCILVKRGNKPALFIFLTKTSGFSDEFKTVLDELLVTNASMPIVV